MGCASGSSSNLVGTGTATKQRLRLVTAERIVPALIEGWLTAAGCKRRRMNTSSKTHICQQRGEVPPWGALQQQLPEASPVPAESGMNEHAESGVTVAAESGRSVPAESGMKKRLSKKETQGKEKQTPSADASGVHSSSSRSVPAVLGGVPRRKEPKVAAKALTKALNDGAQLEEILAGAQRYAKEVDQPASTSPGVSVKHPATWAQQRLLVG